MPKITKDTPKSVMKEIADKEVARIKVTKQTDSNGRIYDWSEKDQLFVHFDEDGKEWVKGVDSSVPGFWVYCSQVTGHNSKGFELKCNAPHFVFLHQDGEKLSCRKCKSEITIKLDLP